MDLQLNFSHIINVKPVVYIYFQIFSCCSILARSLSPIAIFFTNLNSKRNTFFRCMRRKKLLQFFFYLISTLENIGNATGVRLQWTNCYA